jgi:hypothetical protein
MSKLRKVHIENQIWKYVVESLNGCTLKEIRIYSPEKQLYRVKPEDILPKIVFQEICGDTYYEVEPHMIKEYILKNIK